MHSNKYKHAQYWFSNSWNRLWNFLSTHSFNYTIHVNTLLGKCRRRVQKQKQKIIKKIFKKIILLTYLDSPWEQDSNKYKHAQYWFSNSRNRLWDLTITRQIKNLNAWPKPMAVCRVLYYHLFLSLTNCSSAQHDTALEDLTQPG